MAGRRPKLTAAVFEVTLAVSIAALASPGLMYLFVRNLDQLRTGQWWRLLTPVLVQPDGWGQLVFNLLGIAVVGAALQRRLGWAPGSLVYLAGGSGTVALYTFWQPDDTGGGSSAAVAAMIGALLVLLVSGSRSGRLEWFAQLYSAVFAVYLAALQFGGVVPSVIAGNASIIAVVIAHHAFRPSTVTRASIAIVVAAGVGMTAGRAGSTARANRCVAATVSGSWKCAESARVRSCSSTHSGGVRRREVDTQIHDDRRVVVRVQFVEHQTVVQHRGLLHEKSMSDSRGPSRVVRPGYPALGHRPVSIRRRPGRITAPTGRKR